eukprot:jgi/Mesen1/9764/ME000007S09822
MSSTETLIRLRNECLQWSGRNGQAQQVQWGGSLDVLPPECLVAILAKLEGGSSRGTAALVCRSWLALTRLAFTSFEWAPHTLMTKRLKTLAAPAIAEPPAAAMAAIGNEAGGGEAAALGGGAAAVPEELAAAAALLARRFPTLRTFSLEERYLRREELAATGQGPNVLVAVAAACPRLKVLNVRTWNAPETGALAEGLLALSSRGVLLQERTCSRQLLPGVVSTMAAHCATLTHLNIDVPYAAVLREIAGSFACAAGPGLKTLSVCLSSGRPVRYRREQRGWPEQLMGAAILALFARARPYADSLLGCCPAFTALSLMTTATVAAARAALEAVQRRRHLAHGLRSLALLNLSTEDVDFVDPGRDEDQEDDCDAALADLAGQAGADGAVGQAGDNAGAPLAPPPPPLPPSHRPRGPHEVRGGGSQSLGLVVQAMRLPNLEVLKLFNYYVTDADIKVIAGGCPRLQRLTINHSCQQERLTGAGFAAGPGLLRLLFLEVTGLRSAGVAGVAAGCPNLRELRAKFSDRCSEGVRRAYTRALTGLLLAQSARADPPEQGCPGSAQAEFGVSAPAQKGRLTKLVFLYDPQCEWGPFAEAVVSSGLTQCCAGTVFRPIERDDGNGGDGNGNGDKSDLDELQLEMKVEAFEARGIHWTL